MKKPVILLLLLYSSMISFSQKDFSIASHPFQVLFVESASYIGKVGEIEQFDFLSEYDLIRNKGKLVLLHFSGLVIETNDRVLNINQGLDTLKYSKHLNRVIISKTPKEIGYAGIANSAKEAIGCAQGYFEIVYPFFCEEHNIRLESEKIPIIWLFSKDLTNEYRFVFQVKNVGSEVLFTRETTHSSLTLDIAKLDLPNGVLHYTIKQQSKDEEGDSYTTQAESEFEIQFIDKENQQHHYLSTEYYLIIDALVADQKEMYELSNMLFKMSIQESNQDQRFTQLYEDFLERNPQFKAMTE
jgi:hypothetical protein